jgi:large subunit ribosomal protein L13e
MVAKNNRVPNDHLRKYWYHRVKTYFDDPARKKRRQKARLARAKKIAPRPVEGPLRPVVRCPTVRYNRRLRLGRGFTREELKAAGIDSSRAPFLGIAVDKFRVHTKNEATKKLNIDRLVAYKSAFVRILPKKQERAATEIPNTAPQPALFSLPVVDQEVKWRVIKSEEKKADLFKAKKKAAKELKDAAKQKELEKYSKK